MYAVIRIRGNINLSPKVKKTFEILGLKTVNSMRVMPETKKSLNMIKIVENHATFGIINEEMLKKVIEKRGKAIEGTLDVKQVLEGLIKGKKPVELNLKNSFRLSPPRKGFDRKGIKKPFSLGGALGNRKEKINDLIERMI